MSFERINGHERVTPPAEYLSPAVTHLRQVPSLAPVAMLVAALLVAPTATPTGTARSVWQQSLPLSVVVLAIALALAAALIRARVTLRHKESAVMPTVDLRNLTPHPVTLLPVGAEPPVTIPPAGPVPRVGLTRREVERISTTQGMIRMTESTLSTTVAGLPEPQTGVLLIVSRMTAEALPLRSDLVFPDDLVRDGHGAVVGARALGRATLRQGDR